MIKITLHTNAAGHRFLRLGNRSFINRLRFCKRVLFGHNYFPVDSNYTNFVKDRIDERAAGGIDFGQAAYAIAMNKDTKMKDRVESLYQMIRQIYWIIKRT